MSLFPAEAFDHYWAMWNETDLSKVRGHLEASVTDDFIFCDPIHFHQGHDALEANVRQFRADHATAGFVVASGVDTHHNRFRYRWDLVKNGRVLVRGLDVATLGNNGLIERIDGFFGNLPPVASD